MEEQIEELRSQLTGDMFKDMDTKDRIHNLEMKLKYLNSRLVDLATINFVSPKTEAVKQVNNEQSFNWAELNQLLNK